MRRADVHLRGQDHDGILAGLRAMDGQNVAGDATPFLTADELQHLRAKLAGDTFDALDVAVLIDHLDAVTERHEELVQRGAQANDQAQIASLHKDERIHGVERALRQLRHTIIYAASKVNGHAITAMEALEMIGRAARRTHEEDGR